MKNQIQNFSSLFVLFLFITLSSTSCKKDEIIPVAAVDCSLNVYGTYTGTESCTGSNETVTFILSKSATAGKVLFTLAGTSLTFKGDLSGDCVTISIPNQNLGNGTGVTADGTYTIGSNMISGNLNLSYGSCSYSLVKQ